MAVVSAGVQISSLAFSPFLKKSAGGKGNCKVKKVSGYEFRNENALKNFVENRGLRLVRQADTRYMLFPDGTRKDLVYREADQLRFLPVNDIDSSTLNGVQ